MTSLLDRFLRKVNQDGPIPEHRPELGPCWLWGGSRVFNGYGHMRTAAGVQLAHRVSYELFKDKIPEGRCVMHACDVPWCVNPDHLSVGTQSDNMQDKVQKGRHQNGASDVPEGFWEEIRRKQWANYSPEKRKEIATKISDAEKGKSFSPEHLANLRAAHAARRGTSRSVPWNVGREWSPEERQRMSEARKGKGGGIALDPAVETERRRKIAEGRKRYWAAKKAAKESPPKSLPHP